MQYIQVKTGIQFARIVSIDGKDKIAFGEDDDVKNTLYVDAERAKALAFRLLEAVKHLNRNNKELAHG